jgi:hypothetical protein
MNDHKIINIQEPEEYNDAVNKEYVDKEIANKQ